MMRNLLLFLLFLSFQITNGQTVQTPVSGPGGFNDGLVLDSSGNIYASFYFGTLVKKITPDGTVSTYASGLVNPNGLTFTPDGQLLIPEATANRITLVDTGGNKTNYANIPSPSGLLFLPDGRLIVAQYSQNKVSVIDTAGTISDFMTGSLLSGGPVGVAYDDSTGSIFISMFDNGRVVRRDTSGQITQIADLPGNCGFITEGTDYIYATGFTSNRIYRIAKDGSGTEIFAGTGSRGQTNGPVSQARFNGPNGIVASSTGDTLYISDYNPQSLRIITGVNSFNPTSLVEEKSSTIKLWPNPVSETLTVSGLEGIDEFTWRITCMQGKVLSYGTEEVNSDASSVSIHIDSGMSTGIYLFEIQSKEMRTTRKIQIQ